MSPRLPIEELDRLDDQIKKLKTAYEKYFAGIERTAPVKERDEVKKVLLRLLTQKTNNTAFRFRVQSLQATFITHESYWDRVTRQIEEGTYRRELFLLRHHRTTADLERNAATAPANATGPANETGPANATKPAPATAGAPATAAPPPPVATAAPESAHPESIRKLYDAYVRARQSTGDHRPLTIDALATTVKKQVEAIKAKHKCRTVEFKVTVKDGKAVLTAIPKQ
jgi:hypothetical protein